jgi:hypothetical protein
MMLGPVFMLVLLVIDPRLWGAPHLRLAVGAAPKAECWKAVQHICNLDAVVLDGVSQSCSPTASHADIVLCASR